MERRELLRYLKEVRGRVLRDVGGRAHDDVAAVVGEQAALAVQVLPVGRHVGDVQQGEEALEEPPPDVEGALVVGRGEGLPLLAPEQVLGRLAALVLIDLWTFGETGEPEVNLLVQLFTASPLEEVSRYWEGVCLAAMVHFSRPL